MRLNALFRLAFATATDLKSLTLPHRVTSRLIKQKARRRAFPLLLKSIALRLIVDAQFQVLFHSRYPGSFHLSLTVLVHYRS